MTIIPQANLDTNRVNFPYIRFALRFDELAKHDVELIEPTGGEGDCQSWAFEYLGMSEYAHGTLKVEDLEKSGFQEVEEPIPGDLAVYGRYHNGGAYHYGIFHNGNRNQYRITSKLGINGAVCVHPWELFAKKFPVEFYRPPK